MIETPDILHIDHPLCSATILYQGAQLIQWSPKAQSSILWSSDISYYHSGKAFRGGVPICWPWFGKAHSPSHGFARLMPWELISREDTPECVMLEFHLTASPRTFEIWAHPFTLSLQMHLGATCEIRLYIDAPIPTTGALHTYLSTSDITHSSITGLGECYLDSLQENAVIITEDSPLQIHSEVDRIYTRPYNKNVLITPEHTLCLTHQGHSDVVVWNPWLERSEQIEDMKQDDYRHMACIETARVTKKFAPRDSIGLTIDVILR